MLNKDDTLLNELLSDDNLKIAKQRIKKNKGASGIDGMEVKELDEYLSKHLDEIKEQIRNKKYSPKPVKRVEIPKPDGGVRNLGVPTVVDRFVQQAIAQVLTPIYEPKFSESSYGFRPNRCCEMAILKALEFMNDGYQWVVDIDLEKFFDNVNHDKMISLIMKDVKCGEIVSLINKFLKSGIMIDDEYKESVIGTPQGGNLSPLLSNIMLNQLDKELEARGLRFTRYADDCIILVCSSKAADRVMKNVSIFIESKLGLKVNMTKSKVSKPNDIKYLGFGFFMDKNDGLWKAKPHAKSVEKLKLKLKKLTSRRWSISLDERLEKIKKTIVGWTNYYKIGYWKDVARMVDAHVRFRLRMCIWKQWKKVNTKKKALISLGVPKREAWMLANSRKAYARCVSSFLNNVLTNKRLKERGLVFLLDQYDLKHC
ncbi:group II intron reverse transcriptase/maturase [Holdemanella biformis]|uniref:group II intron reverse transcriptase/maturase n=1 Tax=Holdemanella biformis TaxID=1735 RepID=UPI00242F4AC9|nr:group II intron reverse transcriptase/maturase [Holdemanella biformis]MBS6258906.1 group II intron reverse transcriptase/maturase [Holdemanella biformis]